MTRRPFAAAPLATAQRNAERGRDLAHRHVSPRCMRSPPHFGLLPMVGSAGPQGRLLLTKSLYKAVLPVAGLGTRFLPATKATAKEMLPVVDKPLIQYAVEEARAAGIEQFCMVTGRGKTALVEHFDVAFELEATLRERNKTEALALLQATQVEPGSMVTVRQQVPLGLGHAIWCARAFIGDDPFAILLPDDLVLADTPCLRQLADVYQRHRRQRRRGDRGAARAHQPLRHPEDRQRRRPAGRGAGPGGKAGPEGRAVQPVDHRPLCADAGGDRLSWPHGAGRRRRGAA